MIALLLLLCQRAETLDLGLQHTRVREASFSAFASNLTSASFPPLDTSLLISEDGTTGFAPFRRMLTNGYIAAGSLTGTSSFVVKVNEVRNKYGLFVGSEQQIDEWQQSNKSYYEAGLRYRAPADVQVLTAGSATSIVVAHRTYLGGSEGKQVPSSGLSSIDLAGSAVAQNKMVFKLIGGFSDWAIASTDQNEVFLSIYRNLSSKKPLFYRVNINTGRASANRYGPKVGELPLGFDAKENSLVVLVRSQPCKLELLSLSSGKRRLLYENKSKRWTLNGASLYGSKFLFSLVTASDASARCSLIELDVSKPGSEHICGPYALLGSSRSGRIVMLRREGDKQHPWLVWR